MMRKVLWIIVGVLSTINVILDYSYFNIVQPYLTAEIFELIFKVGFPFVTGLAIASLLSAIPFKNLEYKYKLSYVLPALTLIIAGLYTFSTATLAYYKEVTGKDIGPITYYRNVEIPPELDCDETKEGSFETENLIIERKNNFKTQINKQTGKRTEYKVRWISDCEYHLKSAESDNDLKAKVIKIDDSGCECFVTTGVDAQKYRVKRRNTE